MEPSGAHSPVLQQYFGRWPVCAPVDGGQHYMPTLQYWWCNHFDWVGIGWPYWFDKRIDWAVDLNYHDCPQINFLKVFVKVEQTLITPECMLGLFCYNFHLKMPLFCLLAYACFIFIQWFVRFAGQVSQIASHFSSDEMNSIVALEINMGSLVDIYN